MASRSNKKEVDFPEFYRPVGSKRLLYNHILVFIRGKEKPTETDFFYFFYFLVIVKKLTSVGIPLLQTATSTTLTEKPERPKNSSDMYLF